MGQVVIGINVVFGGTREMVSGSFDPHDSFDW